MKNKIVFGRWEMTLLLINAITTQIFLNYPRAVIEAAGTAGWILAIYTTILALLTFWLISKLYAAFEAKDPLDIAEYIGGSTLRVVIGMIIIVHITFVASLILREFAEDMKVIALRVSPISFVTMFFIIGIVVAAYIGLEAIVRLGGLMVPAIIAGLLFIIFGVTPYMDFENLLPILGSGVQDIFIKGSLRIASFSALLILFQLAPFIKTHKNFKSVGYNAISISGILMVLSSIAYISIQSYPTSTESFLPIYQIARLINFGRFFQRVESIFVIIWAASALLYLSMAFFLIVYTLKKTFKLEYYKPLIIPYILIVFTLSFFPPSLMEAIKLESVFFRTVAWVTTFGVMIILLVIGNIIKRKRSKEGVKCV